MADPFIGEIRIFCGNYAPTGWALCNGQLLAISQYTALFAVIGTSYGGNGQTTFGLPDLRGRVPVGSGQGPNLSPYNLGQAGGAETVALNAAQMPSHTHTLSASSNGSTTNAPAGAVLAAPQDADRNPVNIYTQGTPNAALAGQSVGVAGSGQPHTNLQPYQSVNYIIALQGIFPPRS